MQAERAAKEAKKDAASEARRAREAKKAAGAKMEAEQSHVGQPELGVKRKRSAEADTPHLAAKERETSGAHAAEDEAFPYHSKCLWLGCDSAAYQYATK
jgi:hypothetical protein